jgi:hypothetical protein
MPKQLKRMIVESLVEGARFVIRRLRDVARAKKCGLADFLQRKRR